VCADSFDEALEIVGEVEWEEDSSGAKISLEKIDDD
jgi:hypothetical protein